MPKISNNRIKIDNQKTEQWFDVEIFYNKEHHFYTKLPHQFKDVFDNYSKEQLKEIFAEKVSAKKYNSSAGYHMIVSGSTEHECLQRVRTALISLSSATTESTPVILISYSGSDMNSFRDKLRGSFPMQSVNLGLEYCEKVTLGDSYKYFEFKEREWFGEKEIDRHEVHNWRKEKVEIPDTPENREALEALYNAIKILNEKLTEYTKTPESILQLIESKQKLLQ